MKRHIAALHSEAEHGEDRREFREEKFLEGQSHARHDGMKRRLPPRHSPDHRAA
jgi:hypothetical protein